MTIDDVRIALLRYLERRRRNPEYDIYGSPLREIVIPVADLIEYHFINFGQIICPLLEQFEAEGLIKITQRPLHAINWRPTMHDRIDDANAYVVHLLSPFQDALLREFYGKQPSKTAGTATTFKQYFDEKTGEFHFAADKPPLNFRRSGNPFKVFKALWDNRPNEVGATDCGMKKTDFDIALHRMTKRSRNKFRYELPIKSAGSNKKFFLDIPRE